MLVVKTMSGISYGKANVALHGARWSRRPHTLTGCHGCVWGAARAVKGVPAPRGLSKVCQLLGGCQRCASSSGAVKGVPAPRGLSKVCQLQDAAHHAIAAHYVIVMHSRRAPYQVRIKNQVRIRPLICFHANRTGWMKLQFS
jgi:hypothetical protein